jgi:phi13 family phage major tail protein
MATIGLDKMYYAKITEDDMGNETYGIPVNLAKAITAELSVELAEATLYADDGAAYVIKDFKSGTLSLGVDDIGRSVAQDLTGATVDDNGVLISASENEGSPVAIAYRAMMPNGKYRYFWLYKVKFGVPSSSLQTKGDSIEFKTPTIEGTIMRRTREDGKGTHPWKAEVSDGSPGVSAETITGWFAQVYEPTFNPPAPETQNFPIEEVAK